MSGHPVTVAVRRGDGSVEQVRVGTAFRDGDGFRLELGELRIGAGTVESAPAPRTSRPSGGAGMVFPNYGRSKGAPVAGASVQDLEFYANGCRRTLADPAKARWHEKERELLAAIEAELERQGHGGEASPDDSWSSRGSGPRWSPPPDQPEPPPPSDEDIPF